MTIGQWLKPRQIMEVGKIIHLSEISVYGFRTQVAHCTITKTVSITFLLTPVTTRAYDYRTQTEQETESEHPINGHSYYAKNTKKN